MKSATYNVGNASRQKVTADLVWLLEHYDIVMVQEVGDRFTEINAACRAVGATAYYGHGAGASSTVVIYRDHVKPDVKITIPLTPATNLGKPLKRIKGPATVKAKKLVLIHVPGEGWFGSTHFPASLWWPPRFRLAVRQAKAIRDWVSQHRRVTIGVDSNAKPGSRLFNYVGLRSSQRDKQLATHGRAPIDTFLYKGVVIDELTTHSLSSDHRALGGRTTPCRL